MSSNEQPIGVYGDICAGRDAVLARLPLDRYARARILGHRTPYLPVRPNPLVSGARVQPEAQQRPEGPITLPEIAAACAGAFGVTVTEMRDRDRHGAAMRAVIAAASLCRVFSSRKPKIVAFFFGAVCSETVSKWRRHDWDLQADPIYRARYEAAKRALEAVR